MNKVTKLLSVLMVMGAVGAGTAALTGCGGGHTHNPTKVDAKEATCLEDGNVEYYTCDGPDCKDKYFKDETCTEEYTAEEIKTAKRGEHTFVFTDKGDGTHGKTCEHGDFTEETEAHVDKKVNETGETGFDNKCDICGAKFFAPGKFYNESSALEIEVKADGTVVHNATEATLSEISDEGSATYTVNETEYTLTKTATGYSVSWEFYGTKLTKELIPMPEIFVTQKKEFAGVYTSAEALVYKDQDDNYYKVNKIEISADGKVLYEVVRVDKEDGTNEEGNTYVPISDLASSLADVKYNVLDVAPFKITALSAGASTVKITHKDIKGNEKTATFTKDAQAAAPIIPEKLPVPADGEKYLNADKTYSLKYNYGTYTLNDNQLYLLKEETVENNKVYLVRGLDENWNKVNYKLTFVTADEVTTIKVTKADGTELATLSLHVLPINDINTDGATENVAVYDEDKGHGYFKAAKTGWYTFTTTEDYKDSLYIYTALEDNGMPSLGASPLGFANSLTSKPVYLTEGQKIAATAAYDAVNTYPFTAVYSETEPEPDWQAFTGSTYNVAGIVNSVEHYVKGTAAAAGKYYVTISTSKYYANAGAYFEINKVRYGYNYANYSYSQCDSLVYSADLAAGDEVKIRFGCEGYNDFGDVTVYFETKAEYDARIAAEKVPPVFTAEQKGTYKANGYDEEYNPIEIEIVVSDSGITYNGAAITFVKSVGASYLYNYGEDKTAVVTFNANGSLSFNDVTGYKEVPFDGFTATQQGEYTATGTAFDGWDYYDYTITITVSEKAVSYKFDNGWGAMPAELKLTALKDGVYVWRDDNGYTITFSFNADGNLVVSEDSLNNDVNKYTATKGAASEPFEGFTAEQQGSYTYTYDSGRGEVTITITIGATETVKYSYTMSSYEFDLTATVKEGVYTCEHAMFGKVVFSFNADGSLNVTQDMLSQAAPYKAIKSTGTTGGGEQEGGGQEEQSSVLKVGTNTISKFDAETFKATVTFTATEAGTYKFDFTKVYSVSVDNEEIQPDLMEAATKTLTLTANQTVTIVVEQNLTGNDITITIAKV